MSHTTARRVEPHDHAHEHEHGHSGRLRRVWHELSEAVGGHSHDAPDQVDDVLEAVLCRVMLDGRVPADA